MRGKSLFREKLEGGCTLRNGWMSNVTVLTSELFGRSSCFESVTIDMQHGLTGYEEMVRGLSGLTGGGVVPMVRVAWNEPSLIQKALDAGALGVICPMVNSEEDVKRFVSHMYYPPLGCRSLGPIRAGVVNDDYVERANGEVLAIPMIETPDAVMCLDRILEVEGVDGVYVGPSDLGMTHGFGNGMDRTEPKVLELMEYIIERAGVHGCFAGVHTSDPLYSVRAKEMGFRFVTLMSDMAMIQRGLRGLENMIW
jgi:4-hydroxy-2-oxoheptanedioate aldolase